MRVLVVGAGIAGLGLALCLRRQGHTPVVAEWSPTLRAGGYMVGLFGPGYTVCERLGLLPAIQRIHIPIEHVSYLNARGRPKFQMAFSALQGYLDNRVVFFLRGDLERLLYASVKDEVEVRFGASPRMLEPDGSRVRVTFSTAATEDFDLVVGADGIHSWVRRAAFVRGERSVRPLGYHVAALELAELPAGLTLRPDTVLAMLEPGRMLTLYPAGSDRRIALFVYRGSPHLPDRSPAAAWAELRRVYARADWVAPAILGAGPPADGLYYDLLAQVVMPQWSSGRVTLVGDAAHSVTPLAGQGASLALAGAWALAEELSRGTDAEGALARYEERLRPAVLRAQAYARMRARWVVPNNRLQLILHDLVLRQVAHPLVREVFTRRFPVDRML